jgi:YD repeat-containing protein
MNNKTVDLIKGSAMALRYQGSGTPGPYVPETLDRNSLTKEVDGGWSERQPDGLVLWYCPVESLGPPGGGVDTNISFSASSSGSGGSGGSGGSSSGSGSGSGSGSSSSGGESSSSGSSSSSSSSSSSTPSSSSSGSGSSSCAPCDLEVGLGYQRGLLPVNYVVPFLGTPINNLGADSQAAQPMLCTIEQEVFCEPCQPVANTYNAGSALASPTYAASGSPNALDRVFELVQRLAQGFAPRVQDMGNDCGTVVGTCGVNLFNGNLIVTLRTPAGGPSDPPIRFFYNSQSTADGEYGFGWSGLYQQWIQSAEPCCILARLCRIQNPAGKQWTINRDTSDHQGRVLEIIDALDEKRITTLAYDGSHKLLSVVDPAGRETGFTVDAAGDLVEVRHADGTATVFEYDENHLLRRWINPEGDCVTFTYQEDTRLSTIEVPDDGITTFLYDDESQQRTITDSLGNITTITLDGGANIHIIEQPEDRVVTYTWDSTQRLLSVAEKPDTAVYTTYFGYEEMDDHSRSLSSIDRPIGGLSIDYDAAKKRVLTVQQSSATTTLTWEDYSGGPLGIPGKLSRLTDATGEPFDYTYTANGQLETLTDPLDHVMTWAHDLQGRRSSVQNPMGERTTFTYNDNSQVQTVVNAESEVSTYDRDQLNRLVTMMAVLKLPRTVSSTPPPSPTTLPAT